MGEVLDWIQSMPDLCSGIHAEYAATDVLLRSNTPEVDRSFAESFGIELGRDGVVGVDVVDAELLDHVIASRRRGGRHYQTGPEWCRKCT